MVVAVRGAIQVDKNDKTAIRIASVRLAEEIVKRNQIEIKSVISIICSLTQDLTASNPATALRQAQFGDVPLFCVQEANVEGQMGRIIRMIMTYDSRYNRRGLAVYLDGARNLRPDLEKNKE